MYWSTLGFPVFHQLPEFTQTHVYWVGDATHPSHPLLPHSPLALNLSQKQKQALHHEWPKYWSFSFSISPSSEYSRLISFQFSSATVMSDFLQPHGLQHTRLPSPSPTPGACSNSCPLSWWCHPAISFSVIPFFSCLQSFPTSGSFLVSQFFPLVAKVLEFQLQHQSFQWIFRTDFL